ncbi:iron chelate uptake ABC transporter family permease subunit [Azospirillum brasilense]|uniref:iron chelate uptake ABC transporter family permease subunit n=1 Tax=Azospirillum brasilense TaxID=192 RepID=UPI001EDA3C5F|nr:iron chelate uptake ABC transporter family permease subunit [Azospirillum brasilense]UKJ74862.1 iron chelate uptake ABC transporter family permease subunit [Azospirillum brasilense]
MPADRRLLSPTVVLGGLSALTLLSIALFMTLGARGKWDFILAFRGTKIAAMVLVGYAVAVSTVLFQTITNNRILTPSVMGFDHLYRMIQTVLVFQFGSGLVASLDPRLRFGVEVASMVVFSGLLYWWLFNGAGRGDNRRSLHLLLLVGIVFGVLFRSVTNFLQRIIDPNAFLTVQDRLFANFNRVDVELLTVSALVVLAVSLAGWRWRRTFDVLALGRDAAVNLGVEHRRAVMAVLVMVSILVSVSTALVGPVTFFGLLVANLAYLVIRSHRHALILPAAVLLAVLTLVAGQLVLERVFGYNAALSIVIEFVGGLAFLFILVRGSAR